MMRRPDPIPEFEVPPDTERAQACKQKGNEAFGKKQYAEAVGHYSAAMWADPNEPTYPLNRALAYIKLGKFIDAEQDCSTALEISPGNVKALYRRATAKVGSENLVSAVSDFKLVLQLDPTNAEAKAGLAKARQALESQKTRRTEPIDLRTFTKNQGGGSTKSSDVEGSSASLGSRATSATPALKESSSSVEAARKFLQQVGMSDDSEEPRGSRSSMPSTSALPAKLPGETGGFLREVTTRKTSTTPTSQSNTFTSPASAIARITQPASPASASNRPSAAPTTSATAKKTASALNFGSSPSPTAPAASAPLAKPKAPTTPGKMSAIEFHRRWKNRSERLSLLFSIDPESIPGMFDAMLEPELVAEILQTLVESQRAAPQDVGLFHLIEATLTALPRCKRFGMTVSMLDATEKGYAARLIDATGRIELNRVWEVA